MRRHSSEFRWAPPLAVGSLLLLTAASAHAGRNDILAAIDPASVQTLTIQNVSRTVQVRDGSISLQTDSPFCVATASAACHYILNFVSLTLVDFTADTNQGSFAVEQPFAVINTPIAVTDSGDGIEVPAGSPADSGAIISGPNVSRGLR